MYRDFHFLRYRRRLSKYTKLIGIDQKNYFNKDPTKKLNLKPGLQAMEERP